MGIHELNLVSPGDDWEAHEPERLAAAGRLYIIYATSKDKDGQTQQVAAMTEEIAQLTPDTVLGPRSATGESHTVMTRASFESLSCAWAEDS